MRKHPVIVGNWKMHKTIGETESFLREVLPHAQKSSCLVMIAPPFTAIATAAKAVLGKNVKIGAQNISYQTEGAFTGEISAKMVADAGASFVIVGHSERRTLFHESDEIVAQKMQRALAEKLMPILCVGETESEREKGLTHATLARQIDKGLSHVDRVEQIMIAYEPVWAIGTGKSATEEMADEAHAFIRNRLEEKFGKELAHKVKILYGGSVKAQNISALMKMKHIDGALIGGASLSAESFINILSEACI